MMGFDFAAYFSNRSVAPRDLGAFKRVLRRLGDPQDCFRSVHVGGTNGKGSTSAYIASILSEAGALTGLYTSPALSMIAERICVDGIPVEDDLIESESSIVAEAEEEEGVELTGFDRMTATAFLVFRECGVDFAVLEVGLGGRLDATNAATSEVAVLTAIDLDHTTILGSTYEEIAAEKCGIIKEGETVICHPQRPEVMDIIEEVCEKKHAKLIKVENCRIEPRTASVHGQLFNVRTEEGANYSLYTRMLGAHQRINATGAALAARELHMDANAIRNGIERTCWPARMEYFEWDPDILIDGAHNPNAARTLIAGLNDFFPGRSTVFIVSIMRDKDADEILRLFAKRANALIAVAVTSRSLPPEELVSLTERHTRIPTHIADTVGHAYEAALKYSVENIEQRPLIVVAGSLYLAGAIRDILM